MIHDCPRPSLPTRCFPAVLLVPLLCAAAAAQTTFGHNAYNATPRPLTVRAGDVDNDGLPDLVLAGTPGTVDVYRNAGGCSLQPRQVPASAPPGSAVDTAIADVNDDGFVDVVVLYGAGIVEVFAGPSLQSVPPLHALSAPAVALIAADFDFDGDVDLAALCGGPQAQIELLRQQNGALVRDPAVPVGDPGWEPRRFATGCFNGDKRHDFVVAMFDPGRGRGIVEVLANTTPTGQALSFGPLDRFDMSTVGPPALASHPSDVTTGDFDGDGFTDIAVTDRLRNSVLVLQHPQPVPNGQGQPYANPLGLLPRGPYAINGGTGPAAIDRADFDGDGDLDLVVGCLSSVHVFWNQGAGFAATAQTDINPQAYPTNDLEVCDLDVDGNPDIAIACDSTGGNLVLRCNQLTDDRCCHELWAGIADNYAGSEDTACPRMQLQAWMGVPSVGFDTGSCDRRFAHTFTRLPGDITSARLTLVYRPLCGNSTDALNLAFHGSLGRFSWSIRVPDLATSGTVTLDLGDLPGGLNLIPHLDSSQILDVYMQDDTQIDFMRLNLRTRCLGSQPTLPLTHTALVPGATSTWTTNVPAGSAAVFVFGLGGLGCLMTPAVSACLLPPYYSTLAIADPAGDATMTLAVPSLPLACIPVHVQAFSLGASIGSSCTVSDYVQ